MDKYDVLKKNTTTLIPMRIFMKHKSETPIEHLKECLDTAEKTEDPDYYFLTVNCGVRLYGKEILENIVKEAIYMSSSLFMNPYELGKREGVLEGELRGKLEGKLEGKQEGKTDLLMKQLSRRFGLLPVEVRRKLNEADQYKLDLIAESIFDFKSVDDTLKYLQ